MEEQILKIMTLKLQTEQSDQGYPIFDYLSEIGCEKSAKEITSHVMEFIEWIGINYIKVSGGWILHYSDQRDRTLIKTTEKLHQYWLTNIKTK